MVEVSLLIPAFNEAVNLPDTLQRVRVVLAGLSLSSEILVIDDGSTDKTGEVARSLGVTVLTHTVNRGYGAALKTGLRAAAGNKVVIIDADLTYPPERIPELLAGLENAEMVVGARTGPSVRIPWLRRPAKWVISRLANRVAGQVIPDINSGLRAFHKDLALRYFHLYPDGFSFTTTITLAALCDGFRVDYIPIDYARRGGKSKIRPIKDTLNFIILMLRIAAYFEPLRVFLPATFISGTISLILLGYYLWQDQGISDSGVLACLMTFLIFMMGVLADLLVRRSRQ